MRWNRIVLVMLVAGALFDARSTLAQPAGETIDRSLDVLGTERTYRVHFPESAGEAAGLPVLIVLHGGGGNGKQVEQSTGFSQLADREGFVAVYPNGSGRTKLLTWNAHNCCAFAYETDVDDVGFIYALIDQLVADYQVDASRISVTGHSNGAMMTFRIACELSDKIAAAAPNAGALNTDTCAPSSPVPIIIMNGEADENVPVAGGSSVGVGIASQDERIDRPTSHAVDTWVAANGCSLAPVIEDTSVALISLWTPCSNGSVVEQVLIHDWTHRWPSTENGSPLDGATFIWDFVSQFSKPQTQ